MATPALNLRGFLKGLFTRRAKPDPTVSYALNGLDLKLRKHLDFRNGFFVEAGANDGVNQSNTLYFERNFEWRGLLIEPIPELAARCRKTRPNCLVENCALVASDSGLREVTMRYCNLMSLVKGAMQSEAADLQHIQKGCEVQGVESYEVTTPARTLTEVLDAHRVTKVDLLSLDVEGYELPALKGLDLDRIRPRFMLIEARDRAGIDAFLASHYEIVDELSHHDVLYRSRG